MKVIIANPPWPGKGFGARTNVRWPHFRADKCLAFPIYLAYASALLKKSGYDVFAIDTVEKELGIFKFASLVKEKKPNIIFLEISTPSIMYDLETAQMLKAVMPDCLIAVCGPHATHFHEQLAKDYNFIDICIRGEFESTMADICSAIKSGKELGEVQGITWKNKNKVVINKAREFNKNLDDMPYPDRESFKIENYQQAFYSGKKTALLISSRGCPFQCTFCLWPSTVGGKIYRARAPKDVVDEIEYLIKHYNVDELFFDDDTFALEKKRVIEICNEIKNRHLKIKWLCMGRVNTVDEEMLRHMKEAGCYQIFYGFESGSDKILKSVKKGITREEMVRAVKITQKIGLVAAGSFVFGTPEESMETVRETLDFAKKLKADWVQFTLAAPFPGTAFFDEAKAKDLLEINSWSDLDGAHGPIVKTKYLSRKQLEGIIRKAYASYYLSPGIVGVNLARMIKTKSIKRIYRGAISVLKRIIYYER